MFNKARTASVDQRKPGSTEALQSCTVHGHCDCRMTFQSSLLEFLNVTGINFSRYSKLRPQHRAEHVIDSGDGRPVHHRIHPLFWKKRATADKEFIAKKKGGIISRRASNPCKWSRRAIQASGDTNRRHYKEKKRAPTS